MSISATEGVNSASSSGAVGYVDTTGATTTSSSTSNSTGTTVDKNMFLKLMVEQLKNQDPMNPTDSSQFLAQTAQFTSLEKLESMSDSASQSLTAQMEFGASGLVGRSVTYLGTDGVVATGTVGSVRFTSTGPLLGVNNTEIDLSKVTKVAG